MNASPRGPPPPTSGFIIENRYIMFEREKIEIRTLRDYLSSSEFVGLTDSNSSAVLFVPPPSPRAGHSGDFIPHRRGNSSSSLAIRAAISGLDAELARLDREERLLDKFQRASSSSAETAAASFLSGEFVTMSREDAVARNGSSNDIGDDAKMMTNDDDDDDWEVANTKIDASHDEKNNNDSIDYEKDDETSYIPNREQKMMELLASNVVKRISTCNIKVKTELGVIGLALHTAILALGSERQQQSESEQYELLKCTGIPSDMNIIHQLLRNHFHIMKDENDNSSSNSNSSGGGGFAPPIRELPRGQLVPSKWEEMTTSLSSVVAADHDIIAFRYKLVSGTNSSTYSVDSSTVLGVGGTTDASTTLYLVVILPHSTGGKEKNSEVHVSFGTLHPSSSTTATTPTTQIMTFPLGRYVNLDGYKAAKAKVAGGSVAPCLFYIALSELLHRFVTMFESVLRRRNLPETPALSSSSSLPLGYTNIMTMDDGINCCNNSSNAMVAPPPTMDDDKGITTHSIIPHVDGGDGLVVGPPRIVVGDDTTLFPPPNCCGGGDFESDLLPSGLPSPSVVLPSNLLLPGGGGGGNSGGSQVGPNHPMFRRAFGDDDDDNYYYGGNFSLPGGIGGRCGGGGTDMGMRPRFDPYGPPGGPTEPGRGPNFPGRGGGGGRLGRGGFGRGGRGRGGGFPPPGGFGTPNNDHMTPPGGDYFS